MDALPGSRPRVRRSNWRGATIYPSAADPISKNRAIKLLGLPKNIAASIDTSACRLTGNRNGSPVADRG
jgi:hypothetical protein